ncbi:pyridoxal phosphatase [Thorsellia kenyensis]|uniref:Pyridoxal phosphatase n=1 Tax=Thorsellia kenyensis TaxID=1549888 RepID=A0ABV6C9H4_9GAMM
MKYSVIALDLDGTLLNDNKVISRVSLDILSQAQKKGLTVIIATGRHHITMIDYHRQLRLTTDAICCNGVYQYDILNSSVVASTPVSHADVERMVHLGKQHQIPFYLYVDNVMLYSNKEAHAKRVAGWDSAHDERLNKVFKWYPNFLTAYESYNKLWKFSVAWDDISALKNFVAAVESEAKLQCLWSWENQVDIALPGTGKGPRLKEYVESLGKTMNDVIAFGDNFNDVSMLEMAGLGVAMGNHAKGVEAFADLIIGDNNSDSIAETIRNYCF